MTEIEFLHEMVKAAGGNPDMLQDKLKSTYYECLINCLNNGGGSGGGSTGGGSSGEYTQPDWGYKEDIFLPETEVTFAPNADMNGLVGALVMGTALENPLVLGDEYIVNYDGSDYTVTLDPHEQMMGNLLTFGGEDSGEPFLILVGGVDFLFIMPVNQSEGTAKVSIRGIVTKPIDSKYVPSVPYIDLVEAGLPTVNMDGPVLVSDYNQFYKVQMALGRGAIQLKIKLTGTIALPVLGSSMTSTMTDEEVMVTAHLGFADYPDGNINCIHGSCIYGAGVILFRFDRGSVSAIFKKIADL